MDKTGLLYTGKYIFMTADATR